MTSKTMFASLVVAAMLIPAAAKAQTIACADSTPRFEFQVTSPARWIPDSSSVHPTAATRNAPTVVQFMVDTLGVPEIRTFKVLRTRDSAMTFEARRVAPAWRFTPAVANGCRVRQLVQTPVGR